MYVDDVDMIVLVHIPAILFQCFSRSFSNRIPSPQIVKSLSSGKRSEGSFITCTVSPKGQWIYAVAEDNILYCFNLTTNNLEQTISVCFPYKWY